MRTLLLFPPAADPAHPPLGIAALAGYLRNRATDVSLADLNLASYEYLLSPASLARCRARQEARIEALESLPTLHRDQAEEYELVVRQALAADHVLASIPGALADLRNPSTYQSRARYHDVARTVSAAMEFVSAAHYPARWYPRGFSMGYRPTSAREVLAASTDRSQNIFIPFFEDAVPRLVEWRPDIIGISLNFYCQLVPAMTLAATLKAVMPEAMVVIGGGLVCFFEDRWPALAPFRHLVDAWIPYEGELPLAALINGRHKGLPLEMIPGVLAFLGDQPQMKPPPPVPDLKTLPAPSFDGLPLDRYLAPALILPVLTSRGCYWGRCGFCSHARLYRGRYRKLPADAVVAQLSALSARYGCHDFYLCDEAIAPATADAIAAAVGDRGGSAEFRWFGEVRFERVLDEARLARWLRGGCQMLMFGLESAVQRVLDHMCKGTDPDHISRILGACDRVGIRSFVMFFTGFPTETRGEAEKTVRFVEQHHDQLMHIAFTNFVLENNTPVHRSPKSYGIKAVYPYEDEDLKIYSKYEIESGLTAEEAIDFLEGAQKRDGIRSLVQLSILSRSHLVFLPSKGAIRKPGLETPEIVFDRPARIYLHRREDLVQRTLAFDLEAVRAYRKSANDGNELEPCPSHCVFSPSRDLLIDVGDHGMALLGPCDGQHSLSDILDMIGERNHTVALQFYADLARRGLIGWSVRP